MRRIPLREMGPWQEGAGGSANAQATHNVRLSRMSVMCTGRLHETSNIQVGHTCRTYSYVRLVLMLLQHFVHCGCLNNIEQSPDTTAEAESEAQVTTCLDMDGVIHHKGIDRTILLSKAKPGTYCSHGHTVV